MTSAYDPIRLQIFKHLFAAIPEEMGTVLRYQVRRGTGGDGRYRGGDGIRRDIELLCDAQVSLITERRRLAPYGLAGGEAGTRGENVLIRDDIEQALPGKGSTSLQSGDILSIRTPGGGGYGRREND